MQSQNETQEAKDTFIQHYQIKKVSSNNRDLQDHGKLKIEQFGSTDRQGGSHKRTGQREQKKTAKVDEQDWLRSRA